MSSVAGSMQFPPESLSEAKEVALEAALEYLTAQNAFVYRDLGSMLIFGTPKREAVHRLIELALGPAEARRFAFAYSVVSEGHGHRFTAHERLDPVIERFNKKAPAFLPSTWLETPELLRAIDEVRSSPNKHFNFELRLFMTLVSFLITTDWVQAHALDKLCGLNLVIPRTVGQEYQMTNTKTTLMQWWLLAEATLRAFVPFRNGVRFMNPGSFMFHGAADVRSSIEGRLGTDSFKALTSNYDQALKVVFEWLFGNQHSYDHIRKLHQVLELRPSTWAPRTSGLYNRELFVELLHQPSSTEHAVTNEYNHRLTEMSQISIFVHAAATAARDYIANNRDSRPIEHVKAYDMALQVCSDRVGWNLLHNPQTNVVDNEGLKSKRVIDIMRRFWTIHALIKILELTHIVDKKMAHWGLSIKWDFDISLDLVNPGIYLRKLNASFGPHHPDLVDHVPVNHMPLNHMPLLTKRQERRSGRTVAQIRDDIEK
ncbi:hypothetical protein OIO90_004296 [Microbotryomycetes sp. JL221]|nr:hypothetical protein OIO90_004296 [Microbotryomycetes sp. JL221]